MVTLADLEGRRPGPPEPHETFLMSRCRELMTKDLDQFTVEDLRILLGQQLGVPFLLPRAVRVLVDEPLVSGDFHPGDLLTAVLRLPAGTWHRFPAERRQLASRLSSVTPEDPQLARRIADFHAADPPEPSRDGIGPPGHHSA